jgi:radical SAM superfamily enzyme YgiQ (UPF0313 family)
LQSDKSLWIGITAFTASIDSSKEIASKIKSIYPECPIIFGGSHASAVPEHCMELGFCDAVVVGEGVHTAVEISKCLQKGLNFNDIKGLVYISEGKVIRNQPRYFIRDLDELDFPARDLMPSPNRYYPELDKLGAKPSATMITSRGCPYRYIYCSKSVFGRYSVQGPQEMSSTKWNI